jgi:acetyl-CoA carboxylase biotin carboxylase subunit
MFDKVLIANRGEIAVRVIRALREMGVRSTAVYSSADRKSLHVLLADEAVEIGPPPATESYLRIDRILAAARSVGATAIHPGYGFLSENADFAEACAAEGITFIGPPPQAIRDMGDKAKAKSMVSNSGVPVVPGSVEAVGDAEAKRIAKDIGYPVLLKAAKGGGGKGIRAVAQPDSMDAMLRLARGEAESSFKSPELLIEKLVPNPRHVEAQILADTHGRTVFVGERECSVQRRHQKVIEEAPSPSLPADRRGEFGRVAVKAAQAAGYVNAGTVEFLLAPDGSYYFLEMNTRLQVEHPVTEMTTGVDLVKEQIAIAAGAKLALPERSAPRGHAIECRIYAEDAARGFLPSVGQIHFLREPAGPGVRNDSGIYEGHRVPVYYDPMLAKLIVWGASRAEALARMKASLIEYRIEGIVSNIPFLRWILSQKDFVRGEIDTGWLERVQSSYRHIGIGHGRREEVALIAAAIFTHQSLSRISTRSGAEADGLSPWVRVGRSRSLRGSR